MIKLELAGRDDLIRLSLDHERLRHCTCRLFHVGCVCCGIIRRGVWIEVIIGGVIPGKVFFGGERIKLICYCAHVRSGTLSMCRLLAHMVLVARIHSSWHHEVRS